MNSLASTIPYQDGSSDLSLGNTLADLPPDGIAIWIELVHSPPSGNENSQPHLRLPLDLSQAACCGSPSGGPDRPLYQLGGNHGNYYAAVWTYFGSAKPTSVLFTRAQQMLNTFPFPTEFPADMPSTASIGTASGVSIQYPASWYGRLQSDMIYLGQSILLTSYPLGPDDSYIDARDNRPSGGVLILVMDVLPAGDYLHDSMLVPRPAEVKLGSPGGYEGLGDGYRVAFTDSGHAVIVYAAAEPSDEAMIDTILNSITVLPADATRER
jgi:hypothetical protein